MIYLCFKNNKRETLTFGGQRVYSALPVNLFGSIGIALEYDLAFESALPYRAVVFGFTLAVSVNNPFPVGSCRQYSCRYLR